MSDAFDVRPETPRDFVAIARVVAEAFGRELEARLVEAIRASERYVPELALVAEAEGAVVGHVMFSYVTVRGEEEREALLLSPLAVTPSLQRRGAGKRLVREGIARAEARSEPLIIVEGIPAYYQALGFRQARDYGLEPPSERIPDAAFMALPLPAYDARLRGRVVYPPAFDVV